MNAQQLEKIRRAAGALVTCSELDRDGEGRLEAAALVELARDGETVYGALDKIAAAGGARGIFEKIRERN